MLEPLPIDSSIDDIRARLSHTRAIVVVAEPGSGKTTRVPPSLLDAGPAIVLQPRRAAARSIARRIAFERGWQVGREVGWHVRFERSFSAQTRLLIATEGILTARLQQDPLLSTFATIVLDEFHERSIHADLALALAKQALLARDDLRLVVMSATLDAERVAAFIGNCDIVRVPGRRHAVEVVYEPTLPAVDAARRLIAGGTGNLLCFEPGAAEIARTVGALRSVVASDIEVLPLHGSMPQAEQDRALTPGSVRRIVVCTNIAETSVTVPGVAGIVDTGFEKIARYDAARAIDSLMLERITQAAADQRGGRAGRTGPGTVYRLWDRTLRLRPFREPEIHRVDLSGVVLAVAAWGGDPRSLDWFDPPKPESLENAIELLNRMEALDGVILTDIGKRMMRLPLPTRLARMVVAGNASREVIRVAVLLSESRATPTRGDVTDSDLFLLLDGWAAAPAHVRETAAQLERMREIGSAPDALSPLALRRAVLAAYPDRVAQRREPDSLRYLLASGTGAALSSDSGVKNAGFIVAIDLQAPAKATDADSRIRLASAIEPEWLVPSSVDVEHALDARGAVKAHELTRYGALTLRRRPVAADPERAATLLADAWRQRRRSDSDEQLLRRIRFAGGAVDVDTLVDAAAHAATAVDEISIASALAPDLARLVDRSAPAALLVPSGRRIPLRYEEDGTVSAAVKLQELFGLGETPRLGPNREPVLFSLLAPNGRPVQMTRDLKSFWDRTYPDVRKELRGRYPKHPWPEDPWSAVPTHRAATSSTRRR